MSSKKESLFEKLNVKPISGFIQEWIDYGLYQSICLLSKSNVDFNLVVNKVMLEILPGNIYVENDKWEHLEWVDIDKLFKSFRKTTIFNWFWLNTNLVYFKTKEKKQDVLIINLLWRKKYDVWKLMEYFYNIFNIDIKLTKTKKQLLIDETFIFDDVKNINTTFIKEVKFKLIQFKTIIILDEDTYEKLYEDSYLINGTDILFIVFKQLKEPKIDYNNFSNKSLWVWDPKNNLIDFSNLNVLYHKYIDLSILFTKTVMNDYIKKEILSLLELKYDGIKNEKIDIIIDHLIKKWSYALIASYIEWLKDQLDLIDLSDMNLDKRLDIILELLGIDLPIKWNQAMFGNTSNNGFNNNNNNNNMLWWSSFNNRMSPNFNDNI